MTITPKFEVGQEVWSVYEVTPGMWAYSLYTITHILTSRSYEISGFGGRRRTNIKNLFPTEVAALAEIESRKG